MGVITKEKQLIVATKILRILQVGNAVVTKKDGADMYVNAPLIYHFNQVNEKIRFLWVFKFNKDLIRDTVDRLNGNGHVHFKMLNQLNRYDLKFHIAESGFQAYRESFYSRQALTSIIKGIKPIVAFAAGVVSALIIDFIKSRLHH